MIGCGIINMFEMMFRHKLVKNLSANLVIQFVNVGFPLLIQFHLIRTLKLSELGVWYLVTASIALLQLIISFPHLFLVKKSMKFDELSINIEM